MKIFMLGWEFPPFISGGLGTACYGLTRALSDLGHHVIFVLPATVDSSLATHVQLKTPAHLDQGGDEFASYLMTDLANVEFRAIPSALRPYTRPSGPGTATGEAAAQSAQRSGGQSGPGGQGSPAGPHGGGSISGHYGGDMFSEIHRYARIAVRMALGETFHVIHAHDWMTFPAGMAVSAATGKPLVIHVHSTEFDRSGEHVDQRIYEIERQGVHSAHKVIAVSFLTRSILLNRYAAPGDKVEVVYNAIDRNGDVLAPPPPIRREEKIVLFLGRITMQKGPEYFLLAAKKVLEYEENVRFIMAGSGDLVRKSVELSRQLGISNKVLFTGFLRGPDVARVYKMADLYVMPSVSEPFGIAPLEALSHDVPVLISKQSGVSEILKHVLKVDFWDVNEMANKIIAVLRHPPLQATLREHGHFEVRKLTWLESARGCLSVYRQVAGEGS